MTVPDFETAADTVIELHSATWKDGGKTEKRWRAILAAYAFPRLGKRPVNTITSADVLAVLVPHWSTKRETMRKLRQQIGAVMKWAIAEGHRDDNPAGETLGAALPKGGAKRDHHRALPYDRVSDALATVRKSGAWWATKAAFEFLVLTAARSGEVRNMRWDEVDMASRDMDLSGVADEVRARAPRTAVATGTRSARRGAREHRRQWLGVPVGHRPGDVRLDDFEAATRERDRCRPAWLPVELPRLRRGAHELSARGRRRIPGARESEPD